MLLGCVHGGSCASEDAKRCKTLLLGQLMHASHDLGM